MIYESLARFALILKLYQYKNKALQVTRYSCKITGYISQLLKHIQNNLTYYGSYVLLFTFHSWEWYTRNKSSKIAAVDTLYIFENYFDLYS